MRAPTCHLPRVLLICLKRAGPSSKGFSSLVTSSRRYSAGVNTSLAHSQNTSVLCQRKEKLKPKCLVQLSCLAVNAIQKKILMIHITTMQTEWKGRQLGFRKKTMNTSMNILWLSHKMSEVTEVISWFVLNNNGLDCSWQQQTMV